MEQQIYMLSEEGIKLLAAKITENIQNSLVVKTSDANEKTRQEEFLNIDELSKLIRLTKPTIYGHVHRNSIPFIKKGKMLRFSKIDIFNWLEKGKNLTNSALDEKAELYFAKNPIFNR